MKDRPILMSTPMVQAILAGTKTQTRRVVKGMPLEWLSDSVNFTPEFVASPDNGLCPYGKIGDVLWVRETWGHHQGSGRYFFKASAHPIAQESAIWKPSIHMPKSGCRIWLKITDIKAERVQRINEADAKAEGVELVRVECEHVPSIKWKNYEDPKGPRFNYPENSFESLWRSINGPGSWELNPWVWAVSFKVLSTTGRHNIPADEEVAAV